MKTKTPSQPLLADYMPIIQEVGVGVESEAEFKTRLRNTVSSKTARMRR